MASDTPAIAHYRLPTLPHGPARMRVLINSLSASSLSGAHVLFGHLEQLSRRVADNTEFLVLHHPDDKRPVRAFGDNVSWVAAPRGLKHWAKRTMWESIVLRRRLKQWDVDVLFSPAGIALANCPIRQISLAQNPWCLVSGIRRSPVEHLKASAQRRAYRQTMYVADVLVYNSQYMRLLYQQNAPGVVERCCTVAYQGIDEETHQAARELTAVPRLPMRILSVSVMAAWKNAETLIDALSLLRRRGVPAELRFVGPWPDTTYESRIRQKIANEYLSETVTITGRVSRERLHREYAEAKVFCLLSHCESFGIPAVEAQAFGTPVVGAASGAMPEVCQGGGVFCSPADAQTASQHLEHLLTDGPAWRDLSSSARDNAARFHWSQCSEPLLTVFGSSLAPVA